MPNGAYLFTDLADGLWTIQVQMLGFSTIKQEITVAAEAKPATWELKMLPLDQIHAETQLAARPQPPPVAPSAPAEPQKPEAKPPANEAEPARDEMAQRAADGLLINGSQNNGASSPFARYSLPSAITATRIAIALPTAAWLFSRIVRCGMRASFPSPVKTRPSIRSTISTLLFISVDH